MSVEAVRIQSERTVVLIAYVLHLVGATVGLTSIVGLIVNYVRLNQYGDPLASHHRWMIRSFWWALLWFAIGIVTSFLLIGFGICFLAWVWYVYRHVRGMIALVNGAPMPG
jgi:uncharacterized membrane protein